MTANKNLEQRLRRALNKSGYSLHKSRVKAINPNNHGEYMITDTGRNAVVAGDRFNMTLEDVQQWVSDLE